MTKSDFCPRCIFIKKLTVIALSIETKPIKQLQFI